MANYVWIRTSVWVSWYHKMYHGLAGGLLPSKLLNSPPKPFPIIFLWCDGKTASTPLLKFTNLLCTLAVTADFWEAASKFLYSFEQPETFSTSQYTISYRGNNILHIFCRVCAFFPTRSRNAFFLPRLGDKGMTLLEIYNVAYNLSAFFWEWQHAVLVLVVSVSLSAHMYIALAYYQRSMANLQLSRSYSFSNVSKAASAQN